MNRFTMLLICLAGASALGAGAADAQTPKSAFKLPAPTISADFPYSHESVEVEGVRVAYVSAGSGDPVVFIHGNPTSSYLWRNVIPHVSGYARAIALDLPGMGWSSKPDPALRFVDHVDVFEAFVDALDLQNITLVVHDWGAAIGFDYARQHPDRVRAIAFMEGVLPPVFPQPSFEAMGEEMGAMFRAFKDPVLGHELIVEQNVFVEQVLPRFVNRSLGDEEMTAYRRPFLEVSDRQPILLWPREIPIAGEPADVVERMEAIREFMTATSIPLLLIYAEPGAIVSAEVVSWYSANLRNLETVFIGQGLHYIQEDHPVAIGRALEDWMRRHAGR